jgi:hypothetical protein
MLADEDEPTTNLIAEMKISVGARVTPETVIYNRALGEKC